ncbi:hypothetical protein E9536_26535 [Burkholderia sp. LS-044]|nr:hypothetical protein DF135_30810 [Burkholderia cepacia]THJ51058.1 hypothetical protein E9536_26535 [Burkholderia sp. LS-044]
MIIGIEFFGGKYGHRARSCWQCERRRKENRKPVRQQTSLLTTRHLFEYGKLKEPILDRLIVN